MPNFHNTVTTKVADITLDHITEYRNEHGMTTSEAVRTLLRDGLNHANATPGAHVSYGGLLGALGLIFVSAQYATADGIIGPAGILLVATGLVHDLAHRFNLLP